MRTRRPGTPDEPLQEFDSIEQFASTDRFSDGRFSVRYNSHPIDFLFRNSDSDTIVVSFHGAAVKKVTLPWHTGKNVMDGVQAKWLAVSDPSLLFSQDLGLSWFAGSKHHPHLQASIASIVDALCLKTGARNLIFLGGSGGGFAALEMSRRFPGSLAIPMNPQTSITRYYKRFVNEYLDVAWSASSFEEQGPNSVTHDLVDSYESRPTNTIAYVQNSRDDFHVERHQRPFFRSLHGYPHLWVKTGAWGDPSKTGHVIPPKEEVNVMLQQAAAAGGLWGNVLPAMGFRGISAKK